MFEYTEVVKMEKRYRLARKSEPYFLQKLDFIANIVVGIQLMLYLDNFL